MSLTDASQTISGGPLVFYWYATGSNPLEARRGLPMADVTAAGGIVVAPYDVAGAGTYPWLNNFAQHDALFDEVLACAVQKTKISTSRVHALGFSAGGLMTTHLSYARSKYLASVATYSGGAMGQFQESNNKFAAMIMTGGMGDIVVNNFYNSSQAWQSTLKGAGHFAMFCDHGGGHTIPTRLVPGVWQFFVDHPYGRVPSPYQGHIPAGIAPPCIE
jgi:poly(3-hydroxybutyrate) depolymerase